VGPEEDAQRWRVDPHRGVTEGVGMGCEAALATPDLVFRPAAGGALQLAREAEAAAGAAAVSRAMSGDVSRDISRGSSAAEAAARGGGLCYASSGLFASPEFVGEVSRSGGWSSGGRGAATPARKEYAEEEAGWAGFERSALAEGANA